MNSLKLIKVTILLILVCSSCIQHQKPDSKSTTGNKQFWYQQPMRILQTVLREPDANNYNAASVVDYMKQIHCNVLVVNAGGIIDFFDNPLPAANPNRFFTDGDDVFRDFETLASEFIKHCLVIIDGYQGVFFEDFREQLQHSFNISGTSVNWINLSGAVKQATEIDEMISPYLGGDDPLFGSRTTLKLADFFDFQKIGALNPDPAFDLNIIYGTGASLTGVNGLLVYIDLPKNELQFRARAKSITNFGATMADEIKPMYKRFYFVDWVVLNRHKQEVLSRIDLFVDGQRPRDITWAKGDDIREGLHRISRNVFRVRPWFEPGTWGGGQLVSEKY